MRFDNGAFEFAAGQLNQLPECTLPEIVFSGRSNVGKSSLINKLLNRKALARVSSTPGKTGTINFYRLPSCRLVDLPGYGYARVSRSDKLRWAELVEGYFASERKVRLVLQIVDMRHEPTADDFHMIQFLMEEKLPFVIAATKSDKLNKTQYQEQNALMDELFRRQNIRVFPFSAVTGEGAEELRAAITEACGE